MTLLKVDNLSINLTSGKSLVRDISFSIKEGETFGLVGESGSGKSLTALSIPGLLSKRLFSVKGSVSFQGEELIGAPESTLQHLRGDDIAFIFQEPMTALNPLHSIGRQIGEMLELHSAELNKSAMRRRIIELLDEVGLKELQGRLSAYPHELSGGQRQRVMIAMAIANTPKLLIADEPTTALDVTIQAQILDLLKELQEKHKMTMLFISHDLGVVKSMADHIGVMKDGKLIESATSKTLFSKPKTPYTKALLEAASPPEPRKIPESVPTTLIKTENLSVKFPIRKGILRRIVDHVIGVEGADLDIPQGQTLGIVGESGSGKTTLALALLKLVKSSGQIHFEENRIDLHDASEMRPLRKSMQIVFQDPFASLNPRFMVLDIIAEGLKLHHPGQSADWYDKEVCDILTAMALEPEMRHRYPHEFSGGQRQRINIARALVLKPKLVVFDEPTSALDVTVQRQILDLLKEYQRDHGISYLFISHDLKMIRAISQHVLVMKQGKIVESGSTKEIFESANDDYTKSLLDAAYRYAL